MEVTIDKRLQVISFYASLRGFLSERGTGTATTEVKLAQQLVYLEQQALYMVFINLRKARYRGAQEGEAQSGIYVGISLTATLAILSMSLEKGYTANASAAACK